MIAFLQIVYSAWSSVVEIGLALLADERSHTQHVRSLPSKHLELKKHITQIEGLTITSLLDYHDKDTEACIRALKYENSRKAASLLAEVLSRYIETLPRQSVPTRIIAVPLHRTRHVERGYNQVDRVLAALPAPLLQQKNLFMCKEMLTRTRATQQQTSLGRNSRRENVSGAFECTKHYDDQCVFLIDDVVTTGATLREAAHALKAGGVSNVMALALAHA